MKYRPVEEHLDELLKDPKQAIAYVNELLKQDDLEAFYLGLADVARAHGISQVSKKTGLSRQGIYKMLHEKGNPEFSSIWEIFHALGFQLAVKAA